MDVAEASWCGLLEAAREIGPDPDLQELTDDEVEQRVRDGASRIAAQTCRWLLEVAELVVRGVWPDHGARTPGAWLSWACGESPTTAREKVRVALALRHLPCIRARFAAGTLSYSKVRAITRVAVPEIEQQLIDLADAAPAGDLERILRAGRRSADEVTRWQDGPPIDAPDVWDLQRRDLDDETVEIRVRLPRADAAAVEQRLDRLVDLADRDVVPDDDHEPPPAGATRPRGARRAAVLCDALATAVAAGGSDRSEVDDHLVVLHADVAEITAAAEDTTDDLTDGTSASEVPMDVNRRWRRFRVAC
jgi:hypothetical protein